ncbi:hypothetical protein Ait01nite_089440 [Actinoplanes italicus]|uniref:HK97 gp10 family phage protein n=1 Tax=Actinoplanes italicus TaxID=113567 RepID=A0A2T0JIF2_9ACTN|nr:hypothetical protein [Actinoplanes italicus]PRX07360.1 hypothetical protein CLV67_14235 [Actinoplanes italicus]GIE35899.1 hypothetical protein Ait01nite_089440 [Actinoplanes italicus]
MKIKAESSGLDEWRETLEQAERDIVPKTREVISKGSLNIKRGAQRRSSGIAHAPNYPRTITYDTDVDGTRVLSEIGPDKDKAVGGGPHRTPGNLGHIFEYGLSDTPAQPHLGPSLDEEVPNVERYLGELGEDLLT